MLELKVEKMTYARVVNLEYRSAEDLDIFFEKWTNWAPHNMPQAISRTNVRTSADSTLLLAIYESEEIAEKAREMANTFFKMEAEHVREIIDFHGPVIE